jgi:radical SAM protein with 4Fe4S-binding SPASM domain
MIRYASEKGIKTVTSTNAHFLNDTPYLERILTSGLTTLIIAIDSLNKDRYTMYRQGGNLPRAMEGLNSVLALKKKLGSTTLINLRMVLMKSNEHELADMRKTAKKLNVDIFSVKTANPTCSGTRNDEHIVPANPKHRRFAYKSGTFERIRTGAPCTMPWFMFNIHSNGNIVPCCYDYDGEMIVGNAFEKPLIEIWNSQSCRDLRKKLFFEKDTLPKCSDCNINFKLSKTGWIVEVTDCNLSPKRKLFILAREAAKKFLPPKAVSLLTAGYGLFTNDAFGVKRLLTPASRYNPRLKSRLCPLRLPLAADNNNGWTPHPFFCGSTRSLALLSCHASALAPNFSPHPPHAHPEEELFLLLSGELDLILPDYKNSTQTTRVSMKPYQLIFYPAGFAHTIKTRSAQPANYLMLKWQNSLLNACSAISFSSFDLSVSHAHAQNQPGFQPRLLFEGPTAYLKKLHCHVTTLAPQAGYAPHKDPYDVVIVILEGEVETLGQRVGPHSVIFYAAGEPHGMRNPSPVLTARYVVFEFHG